MLKIGDGKLMSEQDYKVLTDGLKKDAPRKTRDLSYFWKVGRELNAMVKKPAYGKSLIHKMAKDIGVNVVLLYDARNFQARYPAENDLKELIEKGVLWTQARLIVNSRLTAGDRKGLVDFIVKTQPTVNELKARVQKIIATKAL